MELEKITVKELNKNWNNYIDTEKRIYICGWIQNIRKQTETCFIILTDSTCPETIQIVTDKFKEEINQLHISTAIRVKGKIKSVPENVKQKFDVEPEEIYIEGIIKNIKDYPIAKTKLNLDYLRNFLHLRSRTRLFGCINRIRHSMMMATHLFYDMKDFYNLDPNILTINECEGGAGVFTVTEMLQDKIENIPHNKDGKIDYSQDHFKRKVYLTVSSQLHLETLALSMKNVYTINKSFRAET
jgi:asparaginyl-tRNA synthetase